MNGREVPPSLDDAESDWRPHPLGSPDDVRASISDYLPQIEWQDKENGVLDTNDYSIEFHVPDDNPVESVNIRIVGSGNPVPTVVELCNQFKWVLFDNQIGDIINKLDDPTKSWRRYTNWRDRVIDKE